MISIGLCAAAFLACVYMGRKSLVAHPLHSRHPYRASCA